MREAQLLRARGTRVRVVNPFQSMKVHEVDVAEAVLRRVPGLLPETVFRLHQLETILVEVGDRHSKLAKRLCQKWRLAGYLHAGPAGTWFWVGDSRQRLCQLASRPLEDASA